MVTILLLAKKERKNDIFGLEGNFGKPVLKK